jgi:predicted  nucleic acid-binding Zn-ribbon protein
MEEINYFNNERNDFLKDVDGEDMFSFEPEPTRIKHKSLYQEIEEINEDLNEKMKEINYFNAEQQGLSIDVDGKTIFDFDIKGRDYDTLIEDLELTKEVVVDFKIDLDKFENLLTAFENDLTKFNRNGK